jgi:Protein of unknown function (DUF4236)
MGFFRFRRSIKLFPGVRWNIGKKSSSLSFGGRGAHYTVGTSGTRTTVGIPGTGLSYTETSGRSPRPTEENSGCAGCLGQILLLLLVLGGISMCVRSDKEPTPTKPSVSPTPQNANSQTSNPTTESDLPDPKCWPKQVRISVPVVLTGVVDGGTISQTAKPGSVLDASLSADHKAVTLRRLGISGTIPVGDTDFMERARKAELSQ